MSNIKWDSELNKTAGFFQVSDDPARPPLSSTDKKTLLNLIWQITYTNEGRKILKNNRPNTPRADGTVPTPKEAEANIREWIQDKFSFSEGTLVNAIIAAHFAADSWIDAKLKGNTTDQAKYRNVYQQNVAVVTWLLWEDAMAHEFSMNW